MDQTITFCPFLYIVLYPSMLAFTQSVVSPLIATRYTSVAGLTVLIYDHILLFEHEVQYIWKARNSAFKWLFLFNRYVVPLVLFINSFAIGPVLGSASPQFCKDWTAASAVMPVISATVINTLMSQRIYALWGWNKTVLKILCFGIGLGYTAAITVVGIATKQTYPSAVYEPKLQMCVVGKISRLFAVGFGISLGLDLLIFILLCLNALDRPRNLHTVIIKQLCIDGFIYFLAMIVWQGITVAMLAGALPPQYSLLFSFFTYAVAAGTVHRMILSLNNDIDDPSEDKLEDDESDCSGSYVRTQWTSPYSLRTMHKKTEKSWNLETEETVFYDT